MASVWKMNCPVHRKGMVNNKTIPMSLDGSVEQCPIFLCEDCDKYYIHTDAISYENTLEYCGKQIVNIADKPYRDYEIAKVICENLDQVRNYTPPFIPKICFKDDNNLHFVSEGLIEVDGKKERIHGYWCSKCGDFYVEDDLYDEINEKFEKYLDMSKEEQNKPETKKERRYSFSMMCPSKKRLKTEEIANFLKSYEELERNYRCDYPFSLLHYVIMFRRFDILEKIMLELSTEEFFKAMHFEGCEGYEWVTPLVCMKWNLNYLYAYDDKNGTGICSQIEDYLVNVEHIDEIVEYTDCVDKNGCNIFSIFWGNVQPMLDVIFYEKQVLAASQVSQNSYSIVMDEVGTGKTVSALYSIRDRIQERENCNEKAKILIVCPYNKREDWQNDIRRQLGRYAHVVEQSDNGLMYSDELKKVFFKQNEHIIMICGQKQGKDIEDSCSALKGSLEVYSDKQDWDMVVIDEAHLSFDNYNGLRTKKAMLLTATPIVVNAKGRRTFDDYIELINTILNTNVYKSIMPIECNMPTENDVYVNWFREDMNKKSAERKIRFVSCKRWSERDDAFYQIKEEKGILAALQYEQDDDYLFWAISEHYGFGNYHKPLRNGKVDRLVSLLQENKASYIIFCEHQFVVNKLFYMLKDKFADCVVAEKYGKNENQYGLGKVQDGQLINTLMQALREKRRVLFVTTGKTGGTGLNLGEFDGVIHYELPFTSIELEQRFGRVDRIDSSGDTKVRDMIFMLNESYDDENDMEINRMLYYCTTKIDVTCQYMPIRNTVLYYPEFIRRNGKAIRETLEFFKKEYILSEENEKKMQGIHKNIRSYEKEIKSHDEWKYIENLGENIRISAIKALTSAKDSRISSSYYDLLNDYLEYWKMTKLERNAYQKMYRKFMDAKKNANNWLAIIGLMKVNEDSDIFVGLESKADGEDETIWNTVEKKEKMLRQSVQKQISNTMMLIDRCVFEEKELQSFSSEGIFCYTNGTIKRTSVKNYRDGHGWK